MCHFRHFNSEQIKVSKNEVVEKVIPVADFSMSADLEVAIAQCGKNDLKVILGDFNAVTGSSRIQGDTALGPWNSGIPNVNTDLPLSFCRGHHLSIAGSWFQRKDIHRFSWVSNDGHILKEIGHILSSCGKLVRQCTVYRSFDVDSDHFPVFVTLKLKLKISTQTQSKHFIPNLSSLSNIEVSREYAANVSSKPRATDLGGSDPLSHVGSLQNCS